MATIAPTKDIIVTLFCHAPTPAPLATANGLGTGVSLQLNEFPIVTELIGLLHQITGSPFSYATRVLHNTEAGPRVLELTLSFALPTPITILRKNDTIRNFETARNCDAVFQRGSVYTRHKRLAVFDMDSTLIQQEVIDLIAAKIGVEAQVSAITARAMNGELDFTASLRERCGLLRGTPATVFEELRSVITLNLGVAELIRALKRLGFKTAVLSGGFTPLAAWLAAKLGLDYCHANHLVVSEDGTILTGEVTGDIVHAEKKRDHVLAISAQEGILLDQVMCVGDGANDLPMMGVAGLGVAFHAKPKVQLEAPAKINSPSMLDILYLFGLTSDEIAELIQP